MVYTQPARFPPLRLTLNTHAQIGICGDELIVTEAGEECDPGDAPTLGCTSCKVDPGFECFGALSTCSGEWHLVACGPLACTNRRPQAFSADPKCLNVIPHQKSKKLMHPPTTNLLFPVALHVDIDECQRNLANCPAANTECQNTIGSYQCVCENGYIRESRLPSSLQDFATDACLPGSATIVSAINLFSAVQATSGWAVLVDSYGAADVAAVPAVVGDFITNGYRFLVGAPRGTPFRLLPPSGAVMNIRALLTWCRTSGDVWDHNNFEPAEVHGALVDVRLLGQERKGPTPNVTFTPSGPSGLSSDGQCLRLSLVSSDITSQLTFMSFVATIQFRSDRRRRRVPLLPADTRLVAVSPSTVVVEFNDTRSVVEVTDVERPVWSGCPDSTEVAVEVGQLNTRVMWTAPNASDNVGVVSTSSTALPGDEFSIFGSPHSVTYEGVPALL